MKREKIFWAGLLLVSLTCISAFGYFFLLVIFPFHVEQMKKRAGETVHHLQTVLPHLRPEVRQSYLEGLREKNEDLSYLLLMDLQGTALVHSDPSRVGMNFNDPGLRRCLTTGKRVEQIYVRDPDKPESPFHNEKTIDILEPYPGSGYPIIGVVNVGISLAAIERIQSKYIIISLLVSGFWLFFITIFALAHLRTVAQRRKADQARDDSERRLSQAIAATSDAIWEWHLPSGETYFSPRWYAMLGYRDGELATDIDSWKRLCHPDDLDITLEKVAKAVASPGDSGFSVEFRIRHRDGHWLWVLARGKTVAFDDNHRPLLLSGTSTDISDRKRSEAQLRDSEARYRSIIENITDVYYRTDKDGALSLISPSGVRLLGYDDAREMVGRPNTDFWANPQERQTMLAMLREKGLVSDYEVVLRRRDGTTVQVSTSSSYYRDHHGDILGVEGIFRDITERKRAEKEGRDLQQQLLQAQKMEAVGRLAGGVAHDFNNMLGVIIGRAELALSKLPPTHPLHGDLLEINEAAKRSAGLTRHLLAFARKQTVAPKVLDLNDTIEKMLTMYRRLIGEDIDLVWCPGYPLGPVRLDPGQLDQLLVNLCVNARDAIAGVGTVTIATDQPQADSAFFDRHDAVPGQRYAHLMVRDTGCGMDQEVLDHIFEPFFTTKDQGRGTGIGLATVFGIVTQNQGLISVSSRPGVGTTFDIYFPCHEETSVASEPVEAPVMVNGQGETILLVEDEPSILELGRVMLETLNYRVIAAASPEEALDFVGSSPAAIDLVMTDIIMPQMNGRDMVEKIAELRPGITALFMSGYTADIIGTHGVLEEGINFLQKPFTLLSLATSVAGALRAAQ